MTQKRKLVSKLFVAVVVLTLVSCCFLASTFARYTSGGSGTGTVEVATWKITGEGTGDAGKIEAKFNQLSPSKDAYVDTARKNSTAPVLVATINYEIDVNGILTLTVGKETITKTATDDTYDEEAIKGLFDIQLYLSKETANNVESLKGKEVASGAEKAVTAGKGTYYVYAVVTWTSDDETVYDEAADARDTWVGANVTSVGYELSYTFVQNSQLPAPQA